LQEAEAQPKEGAGEHDIDKAHGNPPVSVIFGGAAARVEATFAGIAGVRCFDWNTAPQQPVC
jgi:hypothetical protein